MADALVSEASGGDSMRVQVSPSALVHFLMKDKIKEAVSSEYFQELNCYKYLINVYCS